MDSNGFGITGPATAHTFREFTNAFIREKVFAVSPVKNNQSLCVCFIA